MLRFLHRTPFGVTEPVFGRDIGYYVFTLPVVTGVLGFVTMLTTLTLLAVVLLYVVRRDVVVFRRQVTVEPSARLHLAVRDIAVKLGGVATVGSVTTKPGIVTAVVGEAVMTLDMRHLDGVELARMCEAVLESRWWERPVEDLLVDLPAMLMPLAERWSVHPLLHAHAA